jgi:biotin carboxyl carrier protein
VETEAAPTTEGGDTTRSVDVSIRAIEASRADGASAAGAEGTLLEVTLLCPEAGTGNGWTDGKATVTVDTAAPTLLGAPRGYDQHSPSYGSAGWGGSVGPADAREADQIARRAGSAGRPTPGRAVPGGLPPATAASARHGLCSAVNLDVVVGGVRVSATVVEADAGPVGPHGAAAAGSDLVVFIDSGLPGSDTSLEAASAVEGSGVGPSASAVWGGTRFDFRIPGLDVGDAAAGAGSGAALSPMPGKVGRVLVSPGDAVEAGQTLAVVEAMKMEHPVTAAAAGIVAEVRAAAGDQVEEGQTLVTLEANE